MPIVGKREPLPHQPLYYNSLKQFDSWSPGQGEKRYDGIVKYTPRRPNPKSLGRGKLLVCHDYKGGYTENNFARSYTFNFWPSCEIFVYFSHHRVTIPPPGWISAAHRQGVKMLGTLIFEPPEEGEEDCLRLTVGNFPISKKTGQVENTKKPLSIPFSPHYATVLAELARERGFDGYLLNFECELGGGPEQMRNIAAWITVLQAEILDKVGPHGETIWYDSVTTDGKLAWQDRLNSYNLPFFLSSSGFFSNYTWRTTYPSLTAQYFRNLDPALVGNTVDSYSHQTPKTLQDIYMGVDVWGRGSHGGGGFGSYKALSHIAPESLGLSVALFGQGWSWESEQDKPGWTWDSWWEYDKKLWVGPIEGTVDVPEAPPPKRDEPECTHGPFVPISSFFPKLPPPDPAELPFYTNFCPGTGISWFILGNAVHYAGANGWTDVDKQTSLGDFLWPCPKLFWDDDRKDLIPKATSALFMKDAWNGGNSVNITISSPGSNHETAAYQPFWIPIQSLSLTPHRTYEATIVYKHGHSTPMVGVETELSLNVKALPDSQEVLVCNVASTVSTKLGNGWSQIRIRFNTSSSDGTTSPPTHVAIGLAVALLLEEPSKPFELSFLIGQINVIALPPPSYTEEDPIIHWADYVPKYSKDQIEGTESLTVSLTWEIAASFPALPTLATKTPEDPISAWNGQPTLKWFPMFLYFNIYAQPFIDNFNVGPVDTAVWIGTSGWDGQKNGFDVLYDNLPFNHDRKKVRFYIQGVNSRGEVLPWDRCAFIDVEPDDKPKSPPPNVNS